MNTNRKCILIEKDRGTFDICRNRIIKHIEGYGNDEFK